MNPIAPSGAVHLELRDNGKGFISDNANGHSIGLGSILCTAELRCRPSRPPDYEKENSALVALVSALADSPRTILQTLTETILEITQSDSAGVSLLTTGDGDGEHRFYW